MKVQRNTQLPISIGGAKKAEVRMQFAALCYRRHGKDIQILLVTSRGSGRWIPPKGWPMDGLRPSEAAMQEAYEEGGVVGKASDQCLGLYSYQKLRDDADDLPCLAAVFPVRVTRLLKNYPEKSERRRKWFSLKKAAKHVAEPELAQIIRTFDPAMLTTL